MELNTHQKSLDTSVKHVPNYLIEDVVPSGVMGIDKVSWLYFSYRYDKTKFFSHLRLCGIRSKSSETKTKGNGQQNKI